MDDEPNFTRFSLARAISELYQYIYKEEEETATLPIESMEERYSRTGKGRSLAFNRAPSNGIYNIYGHDLGDLVLHTVYYDPNEDLYTLGIDS